MPHTSSAKKRLEQSRKRNLTNKAVKSRVRTQTSKFERALERRDTNQADEHLKVVTKLLQKAAAKKIVHRNTAARSQARLQHRLNAVRTDQ